MLGKTLIVKLKQTAIIVPFIILALITLSLIFQPLTQIASALNLNSISLSETSGPAAGNTEIELGAEEDIFNNKKIVKIVSKGNFSLALDNEGQVYAWGINTVGQLGDGTNVSSNIPVRVDSSGVLNGKKIIDIAAGSHYSLALDSEGQIYSWGENRYGQLGNGTNDDSNTPTEVYMSGVLREKKIIQMDGGEWSSTVLDSDGMMYTWGGGWNGGLGNGQNIDSNVPVEVKVSGLLSGKTITSISQGSAHSLALDSEGQVYSWGSNAYAQLGNHNTINYNTPMPVWSSDDLFGKKIIEISSNGNHSLVLDSEGQIYSWGYNRDGQLGNGGPTFTTVPTKVDTTGALNGKRIKSIMTTSDSSAAIDEEGNRYAWGNNYSGQYGTGNKVGSATPIKISFAGELDERDVSTYIYGPNHYFAITLDNQIYAWGLNTYGQLGNGANTNSSTPVLVNFGSLLDRTITSITFDGVEALSFNVVDGKTIEVVTPPHAAGKVDVVITADDGAVWTITQGYEYVDNSSPEQPTSEVPSGEIEVPSTGYKNKSNFK